MFKAINHSNSPGIEYTSKIPRSCYFPRLTNFDDEDNYIQETLSHKVLGYLDDTTWLAQDLSNLKENLKIAHDFYQLANIHINKDKTILLANKYAKKILRDDSNLNTTLSHIDIEFGSIIKVPLLLVNHKATQILEVYFNPNDLHKTNKKYLFAHLNSINNKSIMFLDNIIMKDHTFLEDYKDIKKNLIHKSGKIPCWYQFLKDNITINNQGRLYFDLDRPIIQNPSAPCPAIPLADPITLYHPKKSQQ
ncbi:hypothetical protein RhiirC2_786706 [Rhizophagus irregularis]|uniref:Reverse transcriptase domain-containing protein n=1 Tax=Rhizophagus irregularis TaxID=588596 RepID=A0A2N1MTU3_9GLOM|nr:hypothetical protein RhiirC2_786706 [Rhizophagus irregularis]